MIQRKRSFVRLVISSLIQLLITNYISQVIFMCIIQKEGLQSWHQFQKRSLRRSVRRWCLLMRVHLQMWHTNVRYATRALKVLNNYRNTKKVKNIRKMKKNTKRLTPKQLRVACFQVLTMGIAILVIKKIRVCYRTKIFLMNWKLIHPLNPKRSNSLLKKIHRKLWTKEHLGRKQL